MDKLAKELVKNISLHGPSEVVDLLGLILLDIAERRDQLGDPDRAMWNAGKKLIQIAKSLK